MSNCERFAQTAQDKWGTVSELLRSLKTNERQWVNCSDCSSQMSDREQFAQVAHDKWATVSDLFINFWQKKSKILFFSMFYIELFVLKKERFAHSLIFGERCEQKWATMSNSLRSLTKNERPWANRSGRSQKMSESLICSFFRKKRGIRSENGWANSQPWNRQSHEKFWRFLLNRTNLGSWIKF